MDLSLIFCNIFFFHFNITSKLKNFFSLFLRLIGKAPFYDKNPIALAAKIRQGQITLPDSLSKDAKDFIQNLLNVDPSKRPTAEVALNHSWIKNVFLKMVFFFKFLIFSYFRILQLT